MVVLITNSLIDLFLREFLSTHPLYVQLSPPNVSKCGSTQRAGGGSDHGSKGVGDLVRFIFVGLEPRVSRKNFSTPVTLECQFSSWARLHTELAVGGG